MRALLSEFDDLPPEVAWQLVDTLFHQKSPLILGAVAFALLGVVGYERTGASWYLVGAAASALLVATRLLLLHGYSRDRMRHTPRAWAGRFLWLAWLTAAIWGAWSVAIVPGKPMTLIAMVVGVQGACMLGAAVRNSAVRAIANGQIVLTLVPMALGCLASPRTYLQIYAAFVLLYLFSTWSLTRFLSKQTLRLLRADCEKTELLDGLATTKQELEVLNERLTALASTDALTGIPNRRDLDLGAARELRRAAREQVPISMLLLDVDHFKRFNDQYGHQAGDECLRMIAAAITKCARRPGDIAARYGGEEFAVVLPATYADGAVQIAESIVATVAERAVPHAGDPQGRVCVSIGVASIVPAPGTPLDHLTRLADTALYTAKRSGRARVHLAEHAG